MQSITNTLIDNSEKLKLTDTIKGILSEKEITNIDIATGYWDIPGTALLADALDSFLAREGTKMRLLIGKDPYFFVRCNANPKYKNEKFPEDFIKTDLSEIEVKDEYKKAVLFLEKYLENPEKIEIHICKKNENDQAQFFHSKCYIFYGKGRAYGIIGSSNFTQKGLEDNAELNYLESVPQIIAAEPGVVNESKGHIFWFNEKWALSYDWTKTFLEEVLRPSKISKIAKEDLQKSDDEKITVLSPYENYIKLLIEEFDEIINFDGKIKPEDYMPHDPDFKKLTYQSEAVNQGMAILRRHHGFILADVVGLGKTFTALMTVKRFLLEEGFNKKVLIVTPPAIKQSWIDSIEYFDKDEISERHLRPLITLTTIGCLEDEDEGQYIEEDSTFKQDDYALIVVDESHRFRNNSTIMYQKLDDLIGRIVPQPYVILLSATPQNNEPYDLRNQIYFFEREHNNSTLQNLGNFGNKLESYFAEKEKNYKEYIKKEKIVDGKKVPKTKTELEDDKKALRADSEDIRKRIVEPLVIRRTRTDISKYYENDMKSQNLTFPKIAKPEAIEYEMKGELGKLFNETVNIIAPQVSRIDVEGEGQNLLDFNATAGENALGYYRYRAIEYLKSEKERKRHEINNLKVSGIAERLAQIMELLLVKRLESSQSAFKESLHNLERYTQNMIKMWNVNRIFICPDIDVNKELNDEAICKNGTFENCLDVLKEKAKKANKKHSGSEEEGANQEYSQKDFSKEYISLLQNDLTLIQDLCEKWDRQNDDPKMTTFIFSTAQKFLDPRRNKNRKIIIFTECIATQKALVQKLDQMPIPDCKVLSVTAKNRDDLKETIAANFDANYKGSKKDDYQILITTDVLAEGVNLHRANTLVNYDSPWNATRLMQRLGRINRIGTDAKQIYSYNFYPSTLGDNQINLKNRTYVKLQAFHELFGEDSQIYTTQEEVKHFEKVEHDFGDEGESPIMPFIAELKDFKENNPSKYEELKSIKTKTASLADETSENPCAFCLVYEKDKNEKLLQKILYISKKDGSTKKASQLEFFEKLKPLTGDEKCHPDFSSVSPILKDYEKSVLNCYASDEQNAHLSVNSKLKAGKKEQSAALKKIQALYETEGISEKTIEMLDEICNSISSMNQTLIRKVLEADFTEKSLFADFEVEILSFYRYTQVKNSEKVPTVQIGFLVE